MPNTVFTLQHASLALSFAHFAYHPADENVHHSIVISKIIKQNSLLQALINCNNDADYYNIKPALLSSN